MILIKFYIPVLVQVSLTITDWKQRQ